LSGCQWHTGKDAVELCLARELDPGFSGGYRAQPFIKFRQLKVRFFTHDHSAIFANGS
jgi:hypothetical protein